MSRAIYVLIFLVTINLVITIYGFVNQPATPSQVVYVPAADKSASASTSATTAPTIAVRLPDEKLLRDMIQSVLKEELTPYKHQLATAGSAQKYTSPHSDVKENSPANTQALTDALSIVDSALANGTWTQQDAIDLISYANQLTPDQRQKIMEDIANAVNHQELKLKAGVPAL